MQVIQTMVALIARGEASKPCLLVEAAFDAIAAAGGGGMRDKQRVFDAQDENGSRPA